MPASSTSSARAARRGRTDGWPPRHLTPVPAADIRRGDGELYVDFIETFCRVTKDSFAAPAGDLIQVRPWTRKLLGHLYARRPDGRRRHRQGLIGLPRKNVKSTTGAGLGLGGLVLGPEGSEVYSCAADKEQARIVFGTARRMVEMDPELSGLLKLYRDAIAYAETGSVYRVLSAEAFTKEGLNPNKVIFDEVHAQPNRELWDVMALASGARVDPLMVGITTAGVRTDSTGQDSLCYGMYQYGRRVASGELVDPAFFMAWWEAAAEADHRDPATWRDANPGYGDFIDPEDFASAVLRTPEPEFRALDVETPILTTSGWVKMRDVAAGDHVFAHDGSPTRVVGVSGVFTGRECFRVQGSDGRSVVADAEHWWPVETYDPRANRRESRWATTQWIHDNPSLIKYLLPGGAVDSPPVELPIDPYILGLWLGDGTATAPELAAHCDDVPHIAAQVASAGYHCRVRHDACASRVYVSTSPIQRHGSAACDTLRGRLVSAGLLGAKHIPEPYLRAAPEQRLALLQGLMDSDGTVAAGRPRFTNTNRLLADGVLYLARSLGWTPRLRVKSNQYGGYCDVAWTAYRDDELLPFRMSRKACRLNAAPAARTRAGRIKIEAVPVESRDTRCLAIEHPSRTFLAGEGLLPTGNTKRCNQWVSTSETWLPHGVWDDCAEERPIPDLADVVLGFDGSFSNDSTALVAVQVGEVPHVDVVACWERPAGSDPSWRVPIVDVEDEIRRACRRWQVREIVCDPFRWARTYQALEAEELPIVEFPQSPQRMVPATQRFYEAVLNGGLTHSGDPRLARHVDNCVLRVDARGSRLSKDTKNSPRKIDLAVAAVMAFDRACAQQGEQVQPWAIVG